MKPVTSLYGRANLFVLRALVGSGALAVPGLAAAGPIDGMVDSVCKLIGPMVGHSKVVSLIFLIALAVMIFLWWMSENKEGVITWILRTGLALGILINIVTLPGLIGLPNVCEPYIGNSGQ
jgi:uncharacterized membrane protein